MIRGEYRPRRRVPRDDELLRALDGAALTADELVRRYCTLVFARTGNYVETARRLGVDRRTVKERLDPALLARLRSRSNGNERTERSE
jgi:hypothetical protein